MSTNNSITVSNDGVRIIDIFLVPNALHYHKEAYDHPYMDPTMDHNELCRRLALHKSWWIAPGDLSAEIWAVGSPYDCQEPDNHSNLTDHKLDADLDQRISSLLEGTGIEPAKRFLNRLPVRMLEGVNEGDIVEMIPGVLSCRMVQLPYRYASFGNFHTTLRNLISRHRVAN